MNNNYNLDSSSGLTLVELLITLTIIGIIVTFASASNTEIRQREKIDATAQAMLESLQLSQDYARQLGGFTALCAGTPEDQCQSNDWQKGWTLFHSVLSGDEPFKAVRYFKAPGTKVAIVLSGFENSGKIIFNGEGYITRLTDEFALAVVCTEGQNYTAQIEIQISQTQLIQSAHATTRSENCHNAIS